MKWENLKKKKTMRGKVKRQKIEKTWEYLKKKKIMRESDIRKKKLERMRRNKMMRENEEIENDQIMKVINEKVISNFFF